MERKYGYIPSPKDLRDYKIDKVYKTIQLPIEFVCEHSNIKNQGCVNSCVAHAISEVLETNDNINYSTGWIYGYRPDEYYQGEGMITSQALKTINKVGYIPNENFNYNVEVHKAQDLVNDRLKELTNLASKKKIVSYARLNSIDEIKQALYSSNKPILLAISVGVNGLILDKKYIAQIPEKTSGGHQLVCYGWNENGLLIQNSWGENWGNKGTFILPYEYPIEESWIIKFNENPQIQIVKPSMFLLRKILQKLITYIKKLLNKN